MNIKHRFAICGLTLLAACREALMPPATATAPPAPAVAIPHGLGPALVARGTNAEGAFNWHRPGPDGKYPPTLLDGAAPDWHHPQAALVKTNKEGTASLGYSRAGWEMSIKIGQSWTRRRAAAGAAIEPRAGLHRHREPWRMKRAPWRDVLFVCNRAYYVGILQPAVTVP